MPNVNLAPYPYAAEQQAIERRRQLALALQQQALQPLEAPPVPGALASPAQGIAKMVQALLGNYQNRKLDQQQKALEQRIQGDQSNFGQQMAKALIPDQPTESQNISTPGPLPNQGAGNATVSLPPGPEAQAQTASTRNMIAQSLASPFPNQQKMGEIFISKAMAEQQARQQSADAAAERQFELAHRPIPEGSAVPNEQGGYTVPNPKPTPAVRPFAPGSFLPDPNNPGKFLQIGQPSQRNIDPLSPEGLAASAQAKAAPGPPPQPAPPMSPERLAQEQALASARDAAAQKRADEAAARRQAIQQTSAPEQIKVGVDKAYQTKDMIQNVREMVNAKPHLLGPVTGRLEQVTQGAGTTFGMQNQQDEQDAATLAGNLGNLLITELQLASPGRTSVQLLPEIKKFSATIKDNPNMLEGFLKGTENRANVVVNAGKRWGIDLNKATVPSGGLPAVGGTFNGAKVLSVTPIR